MSADEEVQALIQRGEEAGHVRRSEENPDADHAAPEPLHEAVPRAGFSFIFLPLFPSLFFFS